MYAGHLCLGNDCALLVRPIKTKCLIYGVLPYSGVLKCRGGKKPRSNKLHAFAMKLAILALVEDIVECALA
jgi:hypothetical protein